MPDAEIPPEAPVTQSVEVPLPPEEAFRLFTADLARWWPMESYSVAAGSGTQPGGVTVDPREGGAITETLPGGATADWARIRHWEPGRRLVMDWFPGRPQDECTEVEIVFAPVGNGTRVTLTHGGFLRFGDGATAMATRYRSGWAHILGTCFHAHCAATCSADSA